MYFRMRSSYKSDSDEVRSIELVSKSSRQEKSQRLSSRSKERKRNVSETYSGDEISLKHSDDSDDESKCKK